MLFSSILVIHDWPDSEDLNRELQDIILNREQAEGMQGQNRSNAGGWQSPGNMMTWTEPAVQTLRHRIETLVFNLIDQIIRDTGERRQFRLIIDAWANINRDGDYNVVHTHPNCMWSGVYYVEKGRPDVAIPQNGMLELIDPREAANYIQIKNTILDAKQFVDNEPGRMLLWPSWMKHMVHPYKGEAERISIAYNVTVIEQQPK